MNEPNDLDDLYGSDTDKSDELDDLYGGNFPVTTTNRQQRRTDMATTTVMVLALFTIGRSMVRPFIANPVEFRSAVTGPEDLYADTKTPAAPAFFQQPQRPTNLPRRITETFNDVRQRLAEPNDFLDGRAHRDLNRQITRHISEQVHSRQDKRSLMATTRVVLEYFTIMLYLFTTPRGQHNPSIAQQLFSRLAEHARKLETQNNSQPGSPRLK